MILDTHKMIEITILNERTLNEGGLRTEDMRIVSNIRNACDVFSTKAFKNIQDIHLLETKSRRISCKENVDGNLVKILTFNIMGRIMVTLEDSKENSVTLVGEDDKGMAGLHTMNGDSDAVLDLLEITTRAWWSLKEKFKADKEVKIA